VPPDRQGESLLNSMKRDMGMGVQGEGEGIRQGARARSQAHANVYRRDRGGRFEVERRDRPGGGDSVFQQENRHAIGRTVVHNDEQGGRGKKTSAGTHGIERGGGAARKLKKT